jgi:hypothetical protein
MGLMQSPQDFVLGVGKGTGSLLSGVASGVLSSTATIGHLEKILTNY